MQRQAAGKAKAVAQRAEAELRFRGVIHNDESCRSLRVIARGAFLLLFLIFLGIGVGLFSLSGYYVSGELAQVSGWLSGRLVTGPGARLALIGLLFTAIAVLCAMEACMRPGACTHIIVSLPPLAPSLLQFRSHSSLASFSSPSGHYSSAPPSSSPTTGPRSPTRCQRRARHSSPPTPPTRASSTPKWTTPKPPFDSPPPSTHSILVDVELGCCGVDKYLDWTEEGLPWSEKHMHSVPASCCRDPDSCFQSQGVVSLTSKGTKDIYQEGCFPKLSELFQDHINYVIALLTAFIVLLTLGLVGTCVLVCGRRRRRALEYGHLAEANPYYEDPILTAAEKQPTRLRHHSDSSQDSLFDQL